MTTGNDRHCPEITGPLQPLATRLVSALPANVRRRVCSPGSLFLLRTVATLLIFGLLDRLIGRVLSLPSTAYTSPVLAVEALMNLGPALTFVVALGLLLLVLTGASRLQWQELQYARQWHGAAVFMAVMLAWPALTLGYNFYLGHAYNADRLLVVLLLPLLFWRPVAILPFLLVCGALFGQLLEPHLGGTIIAHKLQLIRALEVFAAGLVLCVVTGDRRTDHIAFLMACLIAAAYWLPAVAKLKLGWLFLNDLAIVPLAAYAHGWLGWLDTSQVVALSHALSPFDWLLRSAVLAFECCCLFFLFHRRLACALLVAAVLFHLAVFALMGFFFWTWIALDLAFLWMLLNGVNYTASIQSRAVPLALSLILIGMASYWANPPALGWYDTPLSYVYEMVGITADNERTILSSQYFSPYEDVFTMSSFAYLAQDHAVLVGPYGVTQDARIASDLQNARTARDIFALEDAAVSTYRGERKRNFAAFLERFVAARNTAGKHTSWLHRLRPPAQFWSYSALPKWPGDRALVAIEVVEKTRWFDGQRLLTIRELEVARIVVPALAGTGAGDDDAA